MRRLIGTSAWATSRSICPLASSNRPATSAVTRRYSRIDDPVDDPSSQRLVKRGPACITD
jgi:hypothetical protein